MFDHILFGVSDYAASKAFFLKALEPLGIAIVQEGPFGMEMSADGKSSLCIRQADEKPAQLHLAFRPRTAAKSKRSIARRSQRAARTTERPACARSTTRTTTQRSSSVPTATTSRWSATYPRRDRADERGATLGAPMKEADTSSERRVDPEPITIFLAVMAGISGTIAAANYVRTHLKPAQSRVRANILELLAQVEDQTRELRAHVGMLREIFAGATFSQGGSIRVGTSAYLTPANYRATRPSPRRSIASCRRSTGSRTSSRSRRAGTPTSAEHARPPTCSAKPMHGSTACSRRATCRSRRPGRSSRR